MGVKGLRSYLLKWNITGIPTFLSQNHNQSTIFLIDGNGFLFYCAELCLSRNNTAKQYGGIYYDLDYIIREQLTLLIHCNIELHVYFDGDVRMKSAMIESRREKHDNEWDQLYRLCYESNLTRTRIIINREISKSFRISPQREVNQKDLPFPKLSIYQLKAILNELKISMIECTIEADQQIANDCANMNGTVNEKGKRRNYYIYGNDTDFMLYAGCQYIEMGAIDFNSTAGGQQQLFTHIYSRSFLAEVLQVTEDQLLEWSLLLGNDYLHGYNINQYDDCAALPAKDPHSLLKFIRDTDYQVTACKNETLEKRLLYCRLLYNLQAIPDEIYQVDHQSHHRKVTKYTSLTPAESKQIKQLFSQGKSLIEVLQALVGEETFSLMTYEYIEVIEKMLTILQQKPGLVWPVEETIPDGFMPVWEDVCLTQLYQLVCVEMLAAMADTINIYPYELYDGVLFHSLMMIHRKKKYLSPPPISTGKKEKMVDIKLPIDDHEAAIMEQLAKDRVIIIQAETGTGKSSRLPVMLYRYHLKKENKACKTMISQPHRLATKSLMSRVRETLGDVVGMRMGYGARNETKNTSIYFVTTGYLVRLVAHHPEFFASYDYLVIDEIHERSIDCDVLCMLVRNLLQRFPRLKLILMSATMPLNLYDRYFPVSYGLLKPIEVGKRRFPIDIKYAEELLALCSERIIPPALKKTVAKILALTSSHHPLDDGIIQQLALQQYECIATLIPLVVKKGSAVLVFLSGIHDLTEIAERFEAIEEYQICLLHSDFPLEEQEEAFLPTPVDKIKIILATNSAESSITLPDVDTVICTGTCKSIQYDKLQERTHLSAHWICKTSAIQRAGRTGRVRPGVVYRLYSKALYDKLREHDVSEVHRKPLQDLVLNLRNLFDNVEAFQGVIPILNDLIEPPAIETIDSAFDYLYQNGFITQPNDIGTLTQLGRFSTYLQSDLQLIKMIALCVKVGIVWEGIILAAAILQPKTIFRIANPFIHQDPDVYNQIMRNIFISQTSLDAGNYCEPLMYLTAYKRYHRQPVALRNQWLYQHGIVQTRFQGFLSTVSHLRRAVDNSLTNQMTSAAEEKLIEEMMKPKRILDHRTITLIRLVLFWSCDGNVLEYGGRSDKQGSLAEKVTLETDNISEKQLQSLFGCPSEILLEKEGEEEQGVEQEAAVNRFGLIKKIPWIYIPAEDGMVTYELPETKVSGTPTLPMPIPGLKYMYSLAKQRSEKGVKSFLICLRVPDSPKTETLYIIDEPPGRLTTLVPSLNTSSPHYSTCTVYLEEESGNGRLIHCISEPKKNFMLTLRAACKLGVDCSLWYTWTATKVKKSKAMAVSERLEYSKVLDLLDEEIKSFFSESDNLQMTTSHQKTMIRFPRTMNYPTATPLIPDLPLGHRLMSFVQSGYRNQNKIRSFLLHATKEEDGTSSSKLPKAAMKRDVKLAENHLVLVDVAVATCIPHWKLYCILDRLELQQRSKSSFTHLTRQMIYGATCPLLPNSSSSMPMYAIAQSVLTVKSKGGDVKHFSDMVTFLPPGNEFLQAALMIQEFFLPKIEFLYDAMEEQEEAKNKLKKDKKVPVLTREEELKKDRETMVSDQSSGIFVKRIWKDEEFIHMIEEMFAPWMSTSSAIFEQTAEEEDDDDDDESSQ